MGRPSAFFLCAVLFVAGIWALLSPDVARAGIYSANTEVTYKEYWLPYTEMTGGDTPDPGCGDSDPDGTWWLEPWPCEKTVQITIPDIFTHALKAEIYLDLWRNHNRPSARFQLNNQSIYTPTVGSDWSRTPWISEISKSELVQGVNTLRFWEARGGYHIHDLAIRIYFDVSHPLYDSGGNLIMAPEGQLTSVWADNGLFSMSTRGNLLVDDDQLVLTADLHTSAKFVEFHGYYDGYDEDNNGLTLDWHNRSRVGYHPGGLWQNALGGAIDHIGTVAAPAPGRYSIYWSLPYIVNQPNVKFKIRLVGQNGAVRDAAGGISAPFTLTRSRMLDAFRIPKFKDALLYGDGIAPITTTRSISITADPTLYDEAYILGSFWENPRLSINSSDQFAAFAQGEDVWTLSLKQKPVSWFLLGNNTILYQYSNGYGQFVEKPGPLIVLKQATRVADTQAPALVNREPASNATNVSPQTPIAVRVADAGRGVDFRMLKLKVNGAPVQPVLTGSPDEYTLTYTPPGNFLFDSVVSVMVDACDFAGNCMATATHSFTIQPPQLTLSTNVAGGGHVQVDPNQTLYSPGAVVTLHAVADPGWSFAGWSRASATTWWDNGWDYRVALTVNSAGYARVDKPVEVALNFSALLHSVGQNSPFDLDSLRVIEVGPFAQIINTAIPFQFDPAADYDAANHATGTLIWLMPGGVSATAVRTFHLYFDVAGKDLGAPIFTDRVVRSEVIDEGQVSYQIQTGAATYIYQKLGGGFSSVLDRDGNDWINYHDAPVGPGGSYRGIPNAAHPDDMLHPGKTSATTVARSVGPLKETIYTETNDGNWAVQWEFYPSYAKMTMLKKPHNYWFLYEGTPGGSLHTSRDFVMRAPGIKTSAGQSWTGDLPNEEWVYVGDSLLSRSLFLAHHEDDTVVDSYRALTDTSGQMTILGFGRSGTNTYMTQIPAHFTIGLVDETALANTTAAIYNAYKDLQVVTGALEQRTATTSLGISPSITVAMTANWVLTATFSQNHYTLTTAALGSGLIVKQPDQPTYTYSETLTVIAHPAIGWTFTGWTGDLGGVNSAVMLTVDGYKAITATFAPVPYTLVTRVSGNGAIDHRPGQLTYLYGDQVVLTATAQLGWSFAGWSGSATGMQNPTTILMDDFKVITATFTQDQYELSMQVVGNGGVDQTPNQPFYLYNDQVSLLAHPAAGWSFAGWSGDLTSSDNAARLFMDGHKTITATFTQNHYSLQIHSIGHGRVDRSPNQADYVYDKEVQLTARPAVGWGFAGWSGAAMASTNPYSLVITDHLAITATFIQGSYPLTITTSGAGSVTRNPNQDSHHYGDMVELTASPTPGWSFTGWSGAATGSQNPLVWHVTGPTQIQATFTQMPYTLTVSITGQGSVNRQPDQALYAPGDMVILTATPEPGWVFAGWGGDLADSLNPIALTMEENLQATAIFLPGQYTINAGVLGQGVITFDPPGPIYGYGALVTLTATPATGWRFGGWRGDLSGFTNPAKLTVEDNKVITAVFILNEQFALSLATVGQGEVMATPPGPGYTPGEEVTLTAAPAAGWQFIGWSGGLSGTAANQKLSMTSNKEVTATFAALIYQLRVQVSGNGAVQRQPDKQLYAQGEVVQLSAAPATGSTFVGWGGDRVGAANPVTLTISGHQTVTASFQAGYSLTTAKIGNGKITREPDKPVYAPSEEVSLTASPEPAWRFVSWSGNLGHQNPVKVVMTRNRHVTATFVQEEYALTVTQVAHGHVEITQQQESYHYGDVVKLTAIPDVGYTFSDWKWDGEFTSTAQKSAENPLTITITGNLVCTPEFVWVAQPVHLPLVLR